MTSHNAPNPDISHTFSVGEDVKYEYLVDELLAIPAPRLVFHDPVGAGKAALNKTLMQKVVEDPAVRQHYSDRCVLVSCDSAASTEVATTCLASALGLEPNEDAVKAICDHLVTHDRTLIVFDKVDAIYLPEQREPTNLLLNSLMSIDGVAVILTVTGIDYATKRQQASEIQQPELNSAAASLNSITSLNQDPRPFGPSNKSFALVQSKVPPARPAVFHGRSKELERLVLSTLAENAPLMGIFGPGGIGKTTLALKVLHDPRIKQHFGKERFFLTCDGANSVDEVLSHLASKLDVQRSQDESLWPAVLDSLRSRQRVFILLDNFESIWSPTNDELREASEVFLAQLAALDELTLLVTTRGNLLPENFMWANADTAELDTLSSTAARLTFNDLTCLKPDVLASEIEATALTELLREIDFMPLAIVLLARLDDLPSRLLREWSEHYTAVLEADQHDGTRRELSVTVSIKISLAHLPAESADVRPRQVLSVMGQLPAGLFPGVSSELRSTIPNLDSAIHDLLRHSLVYPGGHGELRMLSPVRHYVSASVLISDATLSALDKIYIAITREAPAFDRIFLDGAAYDVELPNVLNVLFTTLDRRAGRELVWGVLKLGAYCHIRNRSCMPLLQKLLPRIGQLRNVRAECEMLIASHYQLTAEAHLAIPFLERAADLFAELEEKSSEGDARLALAELLRKLGQQGEYADQQAAKAQLLKQESSGLPYLTIRVPGEDVKSAEQRFRHAREDRLQAGDANAVALLSQHILQVTREQADTVALTKELKLAVDLAERMMPASTWVGIAKAQLAQHYVQCNNLDDAENLLIEAYALMSWHDDFEGLAAITLALADLRGVQFRFDEGVELAETAARLHRERRNEADAAICDAMAKDLRRKATMYEQTGSL